jgi:hypothetical protein
MEIGDVVKQENDAFREENIKAGKTKISPRLEKRLEEVKHEVEMSYAKKQEKQQDHTQINN